MLITYLLEFLLFIKNKFYKKIAMGFINIIYQMNQQYHSIISLIICNVLFDML